MGKVIKINENAFKRLFEDEDYMDSLYDEEGTEGADVFNKFQEFIQSFAEQNGFEIETYRGTMHLLHIGDDLEGQVVVDFNQDTNQAYIFELKMDGKDIESNKQTIAQVIKIINALNKFNNEVFSINS